MSDIGVENRDQSGQRIAQSRVELRMRAVRGAGQWLPWAGLALAVAFWGCMALAIVTVFDVGLLMQQPPITLIGGGIVAALPGLLILMASFMARETVRSAAANTLVLEAAGQLLAPADANGDAAENLAGRVVDSVALLDTAMTNALASMKALSGELGDERLRLESVSYATADNARDLAGLLGSERAALESLIREMKAQAETLNAAIPRQAEIMVGAARDASGEIARAESALDQRVASLRQASNGLASELERLGSLASGAHQKSDEMQSAVAQIEQRLDVARRTVDSAIRASEDAVGAARGTGDALQSAVSSALDDARRASNEIQLRTREASEDAALHVANLKQAADQARQALKAVGVAARAENDITEKRLQTATTALQKAVEKAPNALSSAASDETVPQPPRPAAQASPVEPELRPRLEDMPAPKPKVSRDASHDLFAAPPERPAPVPQNPVRMDHELFDGDAAGQSMASAVSVESETPKIVTAHETFAAITPSERLPVNGQTSEPSQIDAGMPEAKETPLATGQKDAAWSRILSDMDREDAGEMPREETAETVIRRLETSGIGLSNIFRPRDKKKIATAARKGDSQRYAAIVSSARGEVDRVAKRLRADPDLEKMANDFVTMEAPDAIAALERTQRSNRNASPRLSAFLLLDAALRPNA